MKWKLIVEWDKDHSQEEKDFYLSVMDEQIQDGVIEGIIEEEDGE